MSDVSVGEESKVNCSYLTCGLCCSETGLPGVFPGQQH